MKDWMMMYRDDVGRPLDGTLSFQMNTVFLPRVLVDYMS